jgi:Virulence factor BrkB
MASVADSKQAYPPPSWEASKAPISTQISVWIGLAAFVGWVLSRFPARKGPTYVAQSTLEANHGSGEIKPTGSSKRQKNQAGLLSLVLELVGAVAIRLMQLSFSFWRSALIAKLRHPPEPKLPFTSFSTKATQTDGKSLPDHGSETSPEKVESEEPYQKSIVGLFKNTASVMPGGHILALALFLVFDLGVVVLLFAMIFRYLPDAKIAWRDVWVGATLTAVLFVSASSCLASTLEAERRARPVR